MTADSKTAITKEPVIDSSLKTGIKRGGGLHLTKWPDHIVQLKQENTNEEKECSKNFSPARRTPSIFIHKPIITSHASSGVPIAEDSLNVQAAACLCTCETVQTGIYVHLCVIACFYPLLQKQLPSCSAIMFRLQVILKVASPWRKSEISRVWLLGSDGSTLTIAQALHCGGPRSNCAIRTASTFSSALFQWFDGKTSNRFKDVNHQNCQTFYIFYRWRIFV